MKTWSDVTREELIQELADGVTATNSDLQNQLNWTEYLRHLRDMLEFGMTRDREMTREHLKDVVMDIFMNTTKVFEGRYPEPEEISAYLHDETAQTIIDSLTEVAMGLTRENWPEFKEGICKEVGLNPEEF